MITGALGSALCACTPLCRNTHAQITRTIARGRACRTFSALGLGLAAFGFLAGDLAGGLPSSAAEAAAAARLGIAWAPLLVRLGAARVSRGARAARRRTRCILSTLHRASRKCGVFRQVAVYPACMRQARPLLVRLGLNE